MASATKGDVAVIGGGLAGLTAAIVAAEKGARVMVFEARAALGGRARTTEHEGFLRNEGPRAIYLAGEALSVLKTLGIQPSGGPPMLTGVALRADGSEAELPLGAASLARTKLLGTRAKAELIGAMGRMATSRAETQRDRSFSEWLDEHTTRLDVRHVLEMLTRLGTYAADLDALSAEAALIQSRLGAKGVLYVDGGWQQIVDGLHRRAIDLGVNVVSGESVVSLTPDERGWVIRTRDQERAARSLVSAGLGPGQLNGLLDGASEVVAGWAASSRPAVAACLDVCLERIPRPDRRFDLGLDRPWYVSFHTPGARLAPSPTGEVVHVMKYVPQSEDDRSPADDRAELEMVLDRAQPGWREVTVHARYLHRMVTTHHVPAPVTSRHGRCPVVIDDLPGLFVSGDWVGPDGHLVDASLQSAVAAGTLAASSVLAPPGV